MEHISCEYSYLFIEPLRAYRFKKKVNKNGIHANNGKYPGIPWYLSTSTNAYTAARINNTQPMEASTKELLLMRLIMGVMQGYPIQSLGLRL